MACHQDIPSASLAVSFLHHVAKYSDQLPKTSAEHDGVVHKIMLMSAWLQFTLAVVMPLGALIAYWSWRRSGRSLNGGAESVP